MPRKGYIAKRDVLADPIYNSKLVTRLINKMMVDGKRGIAQSTLYDAFAKIEEKTGKPANEVFELAMENVMPVLELKVRRVGGQNYQVPVEKSMVEKLANEIIDASNGTGQSVKKRDDTHKMAEANKAFAHYNWN